MDINWILKPCVSVGPFQFYESIGTYAQMYRLCFLSEDSNNIGLETYEIEGCESRVYVDDKDNRLVKVGCFDGLIYQKIELFGLTIDELRNIFGKEDEVGDELPPRNVPIEFFNFGLQLWLKDGVVDAAMCGPYISDVEDKGTLKN